MNKEGGEEVLLITENNKTDKGNIKNKSSTNVGNFYNNAAALATSNTTNYIAPSIKDLTIIHSIDVTIDGKNNGWEDTEDRELGAAFALARYDNFYVGVPLDLPIDEDLLLTENILKGVKTSARATSVA